MAELGYAGALPAAKVTAGHLEYLIELEDDSGRRLPAFASRGEPQRIQVRKDRGVAIEEALHERLGGRTTQVEISGDWVQFGKSQTEEDEDARVDDGYWRIEAEYRYRLLRRVQEFGVKLGVLRGSSPVPFERTDSSDPYDVGLNYVSPFVQLRLHELLRLEGSASVAVTEVAFALGGGLEMQLGDPYGTQLVLGTSTMQGFGTMGHARLDIRATPTLRLSPDVEVTSQPHADRVGVRLSGQARYQLSESIGVALRGGYQARDAASGGVSVGSSVSYAF